MRAEGELLREREREREKMLEATVGGGGWPVVPHHGERPALWLCQSRHSTPCHTTRICNMHQLHLHFIETNYQILLSVLSLFHDRNCPIITLSKEDLCSTTQDILSSHHVTM
jgi:hypothetical protein